MGYAIQSLNVHINDEPHLIDINLELPNSGVVTIIGRTLAGKTTLLKVLAGLQEVSSGALMKNKKDLLNVPAWERRVGMVYQQFVNYPHLSVRENIVFPLRRAKLNATAIKEKLDYVSELLGLEEYLERNPSELSGGQQQRVALARSLVKDTDLLLLDEPLVNLDYKLREQLREEFRRLFKDSTDRLVVYATTEPAEAMILQGQVVVLHEGRVVQVGECSDVFHFPATTISAQVFNDPPMNLVDGEIADGRICIAESLHVDLPEHLGKLKPGKYTFGIRAMDVVLERDGANAPIILSEVNGSSTIVHLDLSGRSLVLETEGVHHFGETGDVHFSLDASRLYVFSDVEGELVVAPPRKSVLGEKGKQNGQN